MTVRAALCAVVLGGCAAAEDLTLPPYTPTAEEHARVERAEPPREPAARERAAALLAKSEVRIDDVLAAAELASPEIAAAEEGVLAATGRAWQAGMHPNPVIEVNRDGPAEHRPWGRSVWKFGVRQPIVVSDRRRLATAAELADRDTHALTVDDVRRVVRGEARAAFVDVVYLRDTVALYRELLATAQQLLDLAKARVQAKVSVAPEALKPELEVYTLRNALTGHERRRDAARDRLSALLGGAPVPVDRLVRPEPRAESALPTLVKRALDRHPALRAARQETETAQARLAMARTAERPDIEVSVLVGRDFDENEYVAELGVGIPLAVFDAGQGAIFEARALVAKSRRDAEALEKRIATEVTVRFGEREAARAQLRDLREQLLPLAERTLAATREAYEAGTQEFLDVLDAQRTLLEARAAALALERDTAAADAELAAITGE